MIIVHATPTPRLDLEAALIAVFMSGKAYDVDPVLRQIPAMEWERLRVELDQILSLDYPRPRRAYNSIIVDEHVKITCNLTMNIVVTRL
jgi:hypothetical protein